MKRTIHHNSHHIGLANCSKLFTSCSLISLLIFSFCYPPLFLQLTTAKSLRGTARLPQDSTASVNTSDKPTDDLVDKQQRIFAPHWSTEGGFTSVIYIRNVQVDRAVIVQVSLILKNRILTLSQTKIDSLQTTTINLASVLAKRGEISEQSGAAVITFAAPSAGAVNAYAHVLDSARSLSLSFPFIEGRTNVSSPLNAVAWFYSRDTDAFVSLQNTTNEAATVTPTLFITGRAVSLGEKRLKPYQAITIKLPKPDPAQEPDGADAMGMQVEYGGKPGTVIAQGWILDEHIGFSAPIGFRPKSTCNCSDGVQHLYGTGVAIGVNGMMSTMSPGKIFSPYLAVSNNSERPLALNPFFSYIVEGHHENLLLPQITLNPRESKLINLKNFQDQGIIPSKVGDANIDLQYQGEVGALTAELNSLDQNGSYVSPIPLACHGNGNQHMVFWRTDGDWHSDIILQNVDTEETNVEVTISYPSGIYVLDRHLLAGDTTIVSIKALQQQQIPDNEGRVIPLDATLGGVNLFSSSNKNGLVMNAMLFNPVTGTCAGCGSTAYVQSSAQVDSNAASTATEFRIHNTGDVFTVKFNLRMSDMTYRNDYPLTMTSYNTPVCTVSNTNQLNCGGAGYTYITTTSQGLWYTDSSCNSYNHVYGNGLLTVLPTVSISINGVANADKFTVGGLVVLNSDNNTPPRQMITIAKAQPTSYSGNVTITRNNTNVKLFNAATGGTEITFNGTDNKFANSALPVSLYVEGATFSSTMRDVTLQLFADGASSAGDQATFTVLWVDQPGVSFSGTIAANDAARTDYINWTVAHTDQLGPQNYNANFGQRAGWGTEASGVVHPSNFNYPSNDLKLERDVEFHDWIDNGSSTVDQGTFSTTIPPGNDTGPAAAMDSNPSPNGTIYDWDAPGLDNTVSAPQNQIRRTRNNFKTFASITVGGTAVRCSPVTVYFVRFSMQQQTAPSGTNWVIINPPDVTNDRQAGIGTTALSWDLH